MNLLNKKWYRNLFPNRTFIKVNDCWIDKRNYTTGKVIEVDGKWRVQAFCNCGNELVHSNSFVQTRSLQSHRVFDYKCSNCMKLQHWNPDVIPGLLECDVNGTPI